MLKQSNTHLSGAALIFIFCGTMIFTSSNQLVAQPVGIDASDDLARGLLATPKVFAVATEKIRPTLVTIESFGGVSALQGVIGGIRNKVKATRPALLFRPMVLS